MKPHHDTSYRSKQIGENIKEILSSLFLRETLPDEVLLNASIIVSSVSVRPNLRVAHVFVMPLAGKNCTEVVDALNRCTHYFQRHLGKTLHLRYTPTLKFFVDTSFDEADRLNALATFK